MQRIRKIITAISMVLLAGMAQSCDEAHTPMAVAPVAEVVSTTGQPTDLIAGKSMILDRAFDAATNTTYTFDANNPEDRFLLVPSKIRSGHMMQGLEQIAPVKREFIDQFFETQSISNEKMNGGEYAITSEEGNVLYFREWAGAPLFTESDRRPEKGASVAVGVTICYYDWVCDSGSNICVEGPPGVFTCSGGCRRVRICMTIPDPYWP